MTYSLSINLNEAVKDFAPDLTDEEANSIAESIFNEYDYSKIYDTIEERKNINSDLDLFQHHDYSIVCLCLSKKYSVDYKIRNTKIFKS